MMEARHHVWCDMDHAREAKLWMDEQGWERIKDWQFWGSMSKSDRAAFCHFAFEDLNKALLFKLTWGTSDP